MLLVVLDETRLLKAKNLVYCLNELGKRGVGFILITQYSTSIKSEIRNVGTYFIMAAMSEREVQRFKDVLASEFKVDNEVAESLQFHLQSLLVSQTVLCQTQKSELNVGVNSVRTLLI